MSVLQQIAGEIDQGADISLVLATVWAINVSFAVFTISPLLIGQYATSQRSRLHHLDLMEAILVQAAGYQEAHGGDFIKYIIESGSEDFEEGLEEENSSQFGGIDEAIWILDSLEAFDMLERDLLNPDKKYIRNGFFCIIYTGGELYRDLHISEIFRRLFALYVTNVNVFLMVEQWPHVYTYFPFTPHECHSHKPKSFMSFEGINESNFQQFSTDFFPDKIYNMHGCKLRVSTWDEDPFILLDKDPNTGELIRMHGIEGSILSTLADEMNFKIDLLDPEGADRGYFLPNGTITGAVKLVFEGITNITIGLIMYEKGRADHLLAAYSYYSGPIAIAMPPGHPLSPFERLTKPFRIVVWTTMSSSIVCGIVTIYFIKLVFDNRIRDFVFGAGNRTPFTNLLDTLLGAPLQNRAPRGSFARYLLAVWLLYTLIMRTAYMSELFLLLQDGRGRNSLLTINESVQQNYTFYSVPVLASILRSFNPSVRTKPLFERKLGLAETLERLPTAKDKIALTVLEPIIRVFNRNIRNPALRVYILPEKLMTVPITMFMRKHSYLEDRINTILLDMMAGGVVQRFQALYVDKEMDRAQSKHEPVILSLSLLYGLFSIYLTLVAFSVLVFLMELLSKRSAIVRKIMNFINY